MAFPHKPNGLLCDANTTGPEMFPFCANSQKVRIANNIGDTQARWPAKNRISTNIVAPNETKGYPLSFFSISPSLGKNLSVFHRCLVTLFKKGDVGEPPKFVQISFG